MAQHKAATAVTIAPTSEKSALALWVERYWLLATAAVLVVTGVIVYRQLASEKHEVSHDESWNRLLAAAKPDPFSAGMTGQPKELQELGETLKGQQAGPWALYLAATSALEKAEFDIAAASLARLRADYPTHPLVTEALGADKASPVAALEKRVAGEKAWREAHPGLFGNPPLPADAPRVRIQTSKGPIVIGLYSQLAPKHVQNFLKLVGEKLYDGTKFHRIKANQFIQGGDPNSKLDDVANWGMGGPGYKIEREESGLRHFAGAVAAAKMGTDAESSGSQFYIATTPQHQFDADYVVFGTVLEGLDTAKAIDQGAVVKGTDRPEEPVTITGMELVSG
jgi:peptidyl-prolyl cis-trans isomerase B (cyclophilin B)